MDRTIAYPAQLPTAETLMTMCMQAMKGLAHLTAATMGMTTVAGGLAATPGTGLAVAIGAGTIMQPGVTDASAYGVLPADTSTIMQQYIQAAPVSVAVPAGATTTIYAVPAQNDINQIVLPYYNATTPTQPFAGPNNTGAAQPTVRANTIGFVTANQTGAIPLYTVTVPAGATAITQAMIAQASGSPFFQFKLPQIRASDSIGSIAATQTYAGNPNGHVAGNAAGTAFTGSPPSMCWDSVESLVWVCTTTGTSATAVWISPDLNRLQYTQTVYTSATMLTAPSWARFFVGEQCGGGGGGGNCMTSAGTSGNASAAGGGAAEYARFLIPVTPSNALYLLPAAGGGAQSTGGTTTITLNGNIVSSTVGGTGPTFGANQTSAGALGGSSGGAVNNFAVVPGGPGSDGQNTTFIFAGNGAASYFGQGGRAGAKGGYSAVVWGAGGGGAYDTQSTGNGYIGGTGGQGVIIGGFVG